MIDTKAMVIAALYKMDPRYRPNPLPVGQVMSYLNDKSEDERELAVFFLDAVCQADRDQPLGTSFATKIDEMLKLHRIEVMDWQKAEPGMTPEELQQRVALERAAAGRSPDDEDETGGEDSHGDGASEGEVDAVPTESADEQVASEPPSDETKPAAKASGKKKGAAKSKPSEPPSDDALDSFTSGRKSDD